eukprot:SAG22_NODE_2923_length_2101_cov_1.214286_2_plen_179_part_00
MRALELLFALGAVDESGALTEPIGVRMAELPVEPMLARMLLASGAHGCTEDILSIAAMLQVQGAFKGKVETVSKPWAVAEGDHLTLLNVYRAFARQPGQKAAAWCGRHQLNYRVMTRAATIREQLRKYCVRFKGECGDCCGISIHCLVLPCSSLSYPLPPFLSAAFFSLFLCPSSRLR